MGYRYNLKKKKMEKTGILVIKAKQENINIYINNELYKKETENSFIPKLLWNKIEHKTETSISLLPDEYNVKVLKEGYWPWGRDIIIRPNQATFTPDITLFKKSLPINLINGDIKNINLLRDGSNKGLYFLKDDSATTSLMKFSYENNEATKIHDFKAAPITYSLSSNGERILLSQEGIYSVIDPLVPEKIIDLNKLLKVKVIKAKWDHANDYTLYCLGENNILYRVNLIESRAVEVISSNIMDFVTYSNDLFILGNNEQEKQTFIKTIKNNNEKNIITLPYSKDMNFMEENTEEYLLIKDNKASMIYITEPYNQFFSKIKTIIPEVKKIDWNQNKDKLLYTNDFEIWVYNVKENRNYLLTRLSNPINYISWLPNEDYITFATDSSINITESEEGGEKNFIILMDLLKIEEPCLNHEGKVLYFKSEIGNQKGLFSLELY